MITVYMCKSNLALFTCVCNFTQFEIVCRHRRKSRPHYSDYDVPDDEDPEVSSFFSEPLPNDVYDVPYTCDPYAAFDPDISGTSEDDNHEPAESGNAQQQQQQQRSFKKIGEQWGAMVTPHAADHGKSRRDGHSRYSEEKSAPRRDASFRHDRYKDHRGRMRPAATRTPCGPSPDLSVEEQAVDTTPRVSGLVREDAQTVAEDGRPSPQLVGGHGDVGIPCSAASTSRDMVDSKVQCSSTAPDSLKQEYNRLSLFSDWMWLFAYFRSVSFRPLFSF